MRLEQFRYNFHRGVGDLLLKGRAGTHYDVAHPAILLIGVRREIPAQSQVEREILFDLPIILAEEPECGDAVLNVLNGRFAVSQVKIDAEFIHRLISREVEEVQELVARTLLWAAEQIVLLIAENLDAELQRMIAAVDREDVAPVPIVLDEERWRKAVAEAFRQSPSGSDWRHFTVGTFLAALEPREADGGLVDDG